MEKLIRAKEADGIGKRHLRDLRGQRLSMFAEKFDGQPVATITSAQIDDWLRSLPVAALTRNHYRRAAIQAFNFAVRAGYAKTNPAIASSKAKVISAPPGILGVEQAARLLEAAEPEILPYIAIGLFSGLRCSEIGRLDWSQVDLESDLIEVTARNSKTATRRLVTIQANLRQWLLPLRKLKGSVAPTNHFRELFEKAREAAGITEWRGNALRHSMASYHLAHFKNAATTALELGHHDARVTFAHYRELVRPKEAERFWNLAPATAEKIASFVAAP